jgi:hypothetical protein
VVWTAVRLQVGTLVVMHPAFHLRCIAAPSGMGRASQMVFTVRLLALVLGLGGVARLAGPRPKAVSGLGAGLLTSGPAGLVGAMILFGR